MNLTRRLLTHVVALLLVAGAASGALAGDRDNDRHHGAWFTAWAGPQQDIAAPITYAAGTTLRETVWLTLGGNEVRVKFANTFGAAPLVHRRRLGGFEGACRRPRSHRAACTPSPSAASRA